MADQKRWFKVWTSIVDNPKFEELSLEDIGRWVLLGASTALNGDRGILPVPGNGKHLCRLMRLDTLNQAKEAIERIGSIAFEEGKNCNGEHSVTWKNWRKYQEESSTSRVMRWRENQRNVTEQRRGEEKRGEETRREENIPPISPVGGFDLFWAQYPRKTAKKKAREAWSKLRPDDDLRAKILTAIADQKQSRQWQEGVVPHGATWLNQRRWEDELLERGKKSVFKTLADVELKP